MYYIKHGFSPERLLKDLSPREFMSEFSKEYKWK
jgi:hypothetical protein